MTPLNLAALSSEEPSSLEEKKKREREERGGLSRLRYANCKIS